VRGQSRGIPRVKKGRIFIRVLYVYEKFWFAGVWGVRGTLGCNFPYLVASHLVIRNIWGRSGERGFESLYQSRVGKAPPSSLGSGLAKTKTILLLIYLTQSTATTPQESYRLWGPETTQTTEQWIKEGF
jgi:hypothetical protein